MRAETLDGEGGKTYIRVVTDADAVYAVEDPHARKAGDHLDLAGFTNAQGVATSTASEFTVVVDSPAEEKTLVRISVESHHQVCAKEGLRPNDGSTHLQALLHGLRASDRARRRRGLHEGRWFVVVAS